MFTPIIRNFFREQLRTLINPYRTIRPNIKIGKERFQLQLDVRNFDKDEIRVKARPEYVVIEGKQQRQTKRGLVMRHFIRKFKLPVGTSTREMQSKLSPEGILTITAPRKSCEDVLPCEQLVPVCHGVPQDEDSSFVPAQSSGPATPDPCTAYRDVEKEMKIIVDKKPTDESKPK